TQVVLGDPLRAHQVGEALVPGPQPPAEHQSPPPPSAWMIVRQKAPRSAGERDVMRLPSRTTSRSTTSAPAFLRSTCRLKKPVTVRPLTMSAVVRRHPAWQMAA